MKTIRQEFESLFKHLFPQGTPIDQKTEMERMFFSGYRVALDLHFFGQIGAMPDEQAEKEIVKLRDELRMYFAILHRSTNTPQS